MTRTLLALLALVALPGAARAEPPNRYGDAGRSVIEGGAGGIASNARQSDGFGHRETWQAWANVTYARFVVDDWALSGSAWGGVGHLDDGLHRKPSRSWVGASLGAIYHLPLHRRLSLRFWVRSGLSISVLQEVVVRGPSIDERPRPPEDWSTVALVADFEPAFLVHATSSLALTFGPRFSVYQPLNYDSEPTLGLAVGPGMSLSFGPDEGGSQLEDAHSFAARGKTVLATYTTLSDRGVWARVSMLRFVAQGVGIGGYAGTSFSEASPGDTLDAAAGFEMWGDLPLVGSLSLLGTFACGYAWKSWDDELFSRIYAYTSHELQLYAAAHVTVHLHEGLVVGIGPDLGVDLRLAGDMHAPNPRYVAPGVGSVLAASF